MGRDFFACRQTDIERLSMLFDKTSLDDSKGQEFLKLEGEVQKNVPCTKLVLHFCSKRHSTA